MKFAVVVTSTSSSLMMSFIITLLSISMAEYFIFFCWILLRISCWNLSLSSWDCSSSAILSLSYSLAMARLRVSMSTVRKVL